MNNVIFKFLCDYNLSCWVQEINIDNFFENLAYSRIKYGENTTSIFVVKYDA